MSLEEDKNIVTTDENKEYPPVVEKPLEETPVVEVEQPHVVETPVEVETPVVEVETPVEPQKPVEVEEQQKPVEEPQVETPVEQQKPVEEVKIFENETINKEEVEKFFEETIVDVELDIPENKKKILSDIFLDIIKKYSDSDNYFNKINIKINKEIIDVAEKIITKNPMILNELEKLLLEVIKDNKIDSNDIPIFILIVQIIYERIFSQKEIHLDSSKRAEFCLNILKFFIRIFIEENMIVIDNDKKNNILSQIDLLIECCVNLLNFSNILEQPKVCCSIM